MLANWVKQAVTAGGTGNLTLGSADTGFIDLNTAIGQGPRFPYVIEDGNNREAGIGYLSASTTLVRETVLETLVSGTLTRNSATAINATTSAKVMVSNSAQGVLGAYKAGFYANNIPGMCSMGMVDETGTNSASHGGYLIQMPFWWAASKMVSMASIHCATAAAGATARIGLYDIANNGNPGVLLQEFTAATQMDVSTTGVKTAQVATPFWLPAGFYYVGFQCSSATPAFKGAMYSPAGLFLGVSSSGTRSTGLYRVRTYAALPSDESSGPYSADSSLRLTTWVK